MKSKRQILLLAVLAVALLAGIIWLVLSLRSQRITQPVYQGRPLSFWLESYQSFSRLNRRPSQSDLEVDAALHQIGTNAVPVLLQLLRAHDSGLAVKLYALAQKQKLIKINYVPASKRRSLAVNGFLALGADARDAVPALVEIGEHGPDTDSRLSAMYGLIYVRASASQVFPVLIHQAAKLDAGYISDVVARWVRQFRTEPALVIPALLNLLQETNTSIRAAALAPLRKLPAEPKLAGTVVPALVLYLGDTNCVFPEYVCDTLRKYGADAKPAVPAMLGLLKATPLPTSSNFILRATVVGALRAIDPETAALRKNELDTALILRPSQ